jgi:hypothetical protein
MMPMTFTLSSCSCMGSLIDGEAYRTVSCQLKDRVGRHYPKRGIGIWRLTLGPNRRYSAHLPVSSSLYLLFRPLVSPSPHFNDMARKNQIERAIKEIQGRRPAQDIDFTQHQLENGFTVSTQERVVKEVFSPCPEPTSIC